MHTKVLSVKLKGGNHSLRPGRARDNNIAVAFRQTSWKVVDLIYLRSETSGGIL
jgi:hypothetical protein